MSTETILTTTVIGLLLIAMGATHTQAAADTRRMAETTDIGEIAKRFELSRPRISQGSAVLRGQQHTLTFYSNSRKLDFDNTLIWLNAPTMISRKRWIIADQDAEKTIAPLLRPQLYLAPAETPLVVLDPGHGGEDSGAIGPGGLYEKNVTLDVCRRAATHLRRMGIRVALTRETDETLQLMDRPEIAQRLGAAAFVSIHVNSAGSPNSSGFETYILSAAGFTSTSAGSSTGEVSPGNRFDAANMLLAYCVHCATLPVASKPDRGIRRARFAVLREAHCPSILLEMGFISNPVEEKRLAGAGHRESLAMAIAQGIVAHFRQRTFLPTPHTTGLNVTPRPTVRKQSEGKTGLALPLALQPTRAVHRRD